MNERASDRSIAVDVSTDAWPFSYMPRRVYSVSYLGLIGLVLLVGVALTANFIRERACYRGNRS